MNQAKTETLYNLAVSHRESHNCSAYSYEDFAKLQKLVLEHKPQSILEIGTGIGFTSVAMAIVDPKATIETIEKDSTHATLAKQFILEQGFSDTIKVTNDIAEIYLPELVAQQKTYDLIFFDGYQIHYEFLPHYQKLLKSNGVLVLANTHLGSKTSDRFFNELENGANWKIIDKFGDTIVVQKI